MSESEVQRVHPALAVALAVAGGLWLSLTLAWFPPVTLLVVRLTAAHQMPPVLSWAVDMAAPAALLLTGIKLFRSRRAG
jgi:hypothetical protein